MTALLPVICDDLDHSMDLMVACALLNVVAKLFRHGEAALEAVRHAKNVSGPTFWLPGIASRVRESVEIPTDRSAARSLLS